VLVFPPTNQGGGRSSVPYPPHTHYIPLPSRHGTHSTSGRSQRGLGNSPSTTTFPKAGKKSSQPRVPPTSSFAESAGAHTPPGSPRRGRGASPTQEVCPVPRARARGRVPALRHQQATSSRIHMASGVSSAINGSRPSRGRARSAPRRRSLPRSPSPPAPRPALRPAGLASSPQRTGQRCGSPRCCPAPG
jgi:hypothetical protein